MSVLVLIPRGTVDAASPRLPIDSQSDVRLMQLQVVLPAAPVDLNTQC